MTDVAVPCRQPNNLASLASVLGSDHSILLQTANQTCCKFFMLVIILWGLWNIMNKIGVGKRFPHSSIEIFVKKIRFVQRWRILLNVQDANSLDET